MHSATSKFRKINWNPKDQSSETTTTEIGGNVESNFCMVEVDTVDDDVEAFAGMEYHVEGLNKKVHCIVRSLAVNNFLCLSAYMIHFSCWSCQVSKTPNAFLKSM